MDYNQVSGNWEQQSNNINVSNADAGFVARYIAKVYGWMFLGLVITAVVAFYVAGTPAVQQVVLGNPIVFIGIIIAKLFIVGFLSVRIHKMSSLVATAIFLAYAALVGVVFSVFLIRYSTPSLVSVFAITGGTFGVMSAVGYFTKQDLTSFGRIMLMGLVGVIIASLVNLFLRSEGLYWIISYVGVAVFVGLIAYDTQKIKAYANLASEEDRKKGAILGALALYLDFINLFIMLLRLFGGSRN